MPPRQSPQRALRGAAAGLLTAALAVAAHGVGRRRPARRSRRRATRRSLCGRPSGRWPRPSPAPPTSGSCVGAARRRASCSATCSCSAAGHAITRRPRAAAVGDGGRPRGGDRVRGRADRRGRSAVCRACPRAVRAAVGSVAGCPSPSRRRSSSTAPINPCGPRFCSPLRCRIGVRRSASPTDRTTQRHKKATTRMTIHYSGVLARPHHDRRHRRGHVHRPAVRRGTCVGARPRRRRRPPRPAAYSVLTFKVPDESEKGALTTQLSVALPNVASASTEVMPGWTARLDRDAAAGTVRSVTWTAAPRHRHLRGPVRPVQRLGETCRNQPTVSFPATQTYSDGTVVQVGSAATSRRRRARTPRAELEADWRASQATAITRRGRRRPRRRHDTRRAGWQARCAGGGARLRRRWPHFVAYGRRRT